MNPDIDYLHECFEADYKKGIIKGRERPREHFDSDSRWKAANAQCAGKELGTLHKSGEYRLWLGGRKGRPIKRSRIIFALYHGRWPSILSHKDGDIGNDAIDNLIETTPSERGQRRKLNKNNKTGYKGVVREERATGVKFQGQKVVDGKLRRTEFFDTPEAAAEALSKI